MSVVGVSVICTEFRQRGDNVLLFVEGKFLLLPGSVVEVEEDHLLVSEEDLAAAYDVTPDLPSRVLGSAWKNGIVFPNEMDVGWAGSVARAVPGLSASDIIRAFNN